MSEGSSPEGFTNPILWGILESRAARIELLETNKETEYLSKESKLTANDFAVERSHSMRLTI